VRRCRSTGGADSGISDPSQQTCGASVGPTRQKCGRCANEQSRTCVAGQWSDWSACPDQCAPGEVELCSPSWHHSCNSCQWGECGAKQLYSGDLDALVSAVAADSSGVIAWGTAKKAPTDTTSSGVLFVLDLAGQILTRTWVDIALYVSGPAVLTPTGAVIAAGLVKTGETPTTTLDDGVVVKLDRAGNELWRQTLASDTISALTVTSAGSTYVVGSGRNGNGYVALLNAAGTLLWRNRYPTADYFDSVVVDAEGGAVVHGLAEGNLLPDAGVDSGAKRNSIVAKFAADGQLAWLEQSAIYGAAYGSLALLENGSLVLAELSQISQLTNTGEVMWTQAFRPEQSSPIMSFDSLQPVFLAGPDAIFLAGTASISSVISSRGGFFAEFDLGTRKARWSSYFFDYPEAAAVDPQGNLILAGPRNCDAHTATSCDPSHSFILAYPP